MVFAVNVNQLRGILEEVLPALHEESIFWIAYPKSTSKIATDLSRACNWECIRSEGFETSSEVSLDHVWTAERFIRVTAAPKSKKQVRLQNAVAAV